MIKKGRYAYRGKRQDLVFSSTSGEMQGHSKEPMGMNRLTLATNHSCGVLTIILATFPGLRKRLNKEELER
jgi:hypothetical protein